MRRAFEVLVVIGLVLWLAVPAARASQVTEAAGAQFDAAVEAYRVGDEASSAELFEELLASDLAAGARGPVFYNLGNVHFRRGDFLRAAAAYTAAAELMPRSGDVWHNLELARAKAGLDPADRGDLAATVDRIAAAVRPRELARAAWVLVALLAVLLAVELRRGGGGWRVAIALVVALLLADVYWLGQARERLTASPAMVVSATELHAEPNADHPLGLRVEAGARVTVLDRLGAAGSRGAWVRVETEDGPGWIRDDELFDWTTRSL